MTHAKLRMFTPNPIGDAKKATEVLLCLSQPSRAEVDNGMPKAIAAGSNTYNQRQDYGFMYGHGFQDLDGYIWGLRC